MIGTITSKRWNTLATAKIPIVALLIPLSTHQHNSFIAGIPIDYLILKIRETDLFFHSFFIS